MLIPAPMGWVSIAIYEQRGCGVSELADLLARIEKIESQHRQWWRFFLQYLISPIVLVLIAAYFNHNLERTKQDFQNLALEVQRLEAAQDMLSELFSDIPERAFVADRLMSQLVDDELAAEISQIVTNYYSHKLDRMLSTDSVETVEQIMIAAEAIGGVAAESIARELEMKNYYVVVASVEPDNRIGALNAANSLKEKGYDAEVYLSISGYLGITVGKSPLEGARKLQIDAIANGDANEDSFLAPEERFTEKIPFN